LLNDKDRITREKNQANHEKSLTKNGVNALTREIEHLRRDTDVDKKKIIDLIRFRDMMSKSISKAVDENDKNKEDISKMQTKISLLHQQNNSKQENIFELLQQIYSLEKERDRFSLEASKANSSLMQVVEEVKLKQNLITELKKENIEFEGKLKQQQNLYEAVRADRNLYSKNLIEAQDNVAELRRKFVIASH
jgi:chromosome segregation ATPase